MATLQLAAPDDPAAEARLLQPWLRAYALRFGVAPAVRRDTTGLVLEFPRHDDSAWRAATGRVDVLGGHPAVRAHLRALGFAWDEREALTVAPSPASCAARLAALGHQSGSEPAYYQVDGPTMNKRVWLAGCLRGEVPLALGSATWYAALALRSCLPPRPGRRARATTDHHFWGVQHDLTKHWLLTHLVPRELVLAVGARLSAGLRAWHRGPLAPAPLVRFYENDLLSFCQQIWRDLEDPALFAPTCRLPANATQLWQAVERRLAETARGPQVWLRDDADSRPTFAISYPSRRTGPGGQGPRDMSPGT